MQFQSIILMSYDKWALSQHSGVSFKASFKPVSSATETRALENWYFICSKLIYDTLQKANKKGADQIARMSSLVCDCVVREPLNIGFLVLRPICSP